MEPKLVARDFSLLELPGRSTQSVMWSPPEEFEQTSPGLYEMTKQWLVGRSSPVRRTALDVVRVVFFARSEEPRSFAEAKEWAENDRRSLSSAYPSAMENKLIAVEFIPKQQVGGEQIPEVRIGIIEDFAQKTPGHVLQSGGFHRPGMLPLDVIRVVCPKLDGRTPSTLDEALNWVYRPLPVKDMSLAAVDYIFPKNIPDAKWMERHILPQDLPEKKAGVHKLKEDHFFGTRAVFYLAPDENPLEIPYVKARERAEKDAHRKKTSPEEPEKKPTIYKTAEDISMEISALEAVLRATATDLGVPSSVHWHDGARYALDWVLREEGLAPGAIK